jgi:mRNA interferase MazF
VTGVILSDQVKSLDWAARQAEFLESLPADTVAEALAKLGLLLAAGPRGAP